MIKYYEKTEFNIQQNITIRAYCSTNQRLPSTLVTYYVLLLKKFDYIDLHIVL